ncbi:MAG TPA: hypothetical protein VFH73_01455 [Polyangia bacterium]|jgi:hypothetical protein|nr:hypothetical protein [Polyangia bacterium]
MRQFSSTGFRLWNLSREAKVLYTTFCVLILFGIASSALYYGDLVGGKLDGVRRYYAGAGAPDDRQPAPASTPPPDRRAQPIVEIPGDADTARQPLVVAVTYRKLLEVTHFHLFTMPVVLLIVGHLFFATGASDRAKLGWVLAASGSLFAHLATPWLVAFVTPGLAWLHALSGAAMTLTMTVLTAVPVVAMWRRRPARAD